MNENKTPKRHPPEVGKFQTEVAERKTIKRNIKIDIPMTYDVFFPFMSSALYMSHAPHSSLIRRNRFFFRFSRSTTQLTAIRFTVQQQSASKLTLHQQQFTEFFSSSN